MAATTTFQNVGAASTSTSFPVSGLTPGTGYDFDVVASNSAGSATSNILTVTTGNYTLPSAPTNVTVSSVTSTSAVLSWAASTTGSSPITYQAQYQVQGQTSWTPVGSPSASVSATISGLQPGTPCNFSVLAINPAGSVISSIAQATTLSLSVPPSLPTGLQVLSASTTSLTIGWNASATGSQPITYQLQYRVSGQGAAWANVGPASSALSGTASGLTPGQTYDFQVIASGPGGTVASTTFTASTPAITVPPSVPGGFAVVGITSTSATLSWSASSGTTPILYQPQYRPSGTTAWSDFGQPISALSVTITSLVSGRTYDFQVVARNGVGSTPSATQTAATLSQVVRPSAPGAPVAWIITPTSVSLSWSASASGTMPIAYQPQFRVAGTATWQSYGMPSAMTAATVTGLTPGTDYEFQVLAANSAGSVASNTLTILAPTTGAAVSPSASFRPNSVLTAEELDAEFDSKLDKSGGAVGPITIAQAGAGAPLTSALAITRSNGGSSDSDMVSGSYTAIYRDGPTAAYSALAMAVTIPGDGTGYGPAGSFAGLHGAVSVSAARSGADGNSRHTALRGRADRSTPSGGVPAGAQLGEIHGALVSAADHTGLPSSQSGRMTGAHATVTANGLDDAGIRYGLKIIYGEDIALGSGGEPADFSSILCLAPSTPTAFAHSVVSIGGKYSTSVLDFRTASSSTAKITSSTPSSPVTTLSVDNALPFAGAGVNGAATNASNPKNVTINGNAYRVTAVTVTPGLTSGVLTFASAVTVADATYGNTIVPEAHTVWLADGGDIALNTAGTSRVAADPSAGGALVLTAASGAPVILKGSAAQLPTGPSQQRPSAPALGHLRGNSDLGTYEVYVPSAGAWASLVTTSSTGGIAPTPATSLIAGTPAGGAVALSWTAPATGSPPLNYQVQYRVTGTNGWTNWGGTTQTTSTTVTGLTPGTRYDFQVVTSNGAGSSTSAITSVNIPAATPSAPTGLTVGSATSTTLTANWTASSSGTTPISYQVNYRATGQSAWISAGQPTANTTLTISGLSPATQYDVQVVAQNTAGSTASSTVSATTAASAGSAPSAPTGVSATSPTSSSIVVAWTLSTSGSPTYVVQYRVTGQSTWITFGQPTTSSSETVVGLTAATSYDFQVVATNNAGSTASSTVTGVTTANPVASTGSVAGSQTSGASYPVVQGPTSGAATVSTILPISGVTITDPAAAAAAGSCTLVMTCSFGTLSSTVGSAQVAGSNTKSITYTNALGPCQTAAADLVYTAPASPTSDNIVVKFTDQTGSSHQISISVSVTAASSGGGSPGGTIPTDATGERAKRSQDMLNGFGVNTHIDNAGYQGAGLALIENCINYLGGIKLLRDCPTGPNIGTYWSQVAQACNVQFIAYIPNAAAADFDTLFNCTGAVPGQYLVAFEGCQEADSGQMFGYAETLQDAVNYQPTIWDGGQQYGIPVIQLSIGQGWDTNPTQGNYPTVGNLAAYATYGNLHFYPAASPAATLSGMMNLAKMPTPGKPVAITEFGWHQINGSGYNDVSQATAAAYTVQTIFDAFNAGCPYYIYYELIDDNALESSIYGLFTDAGVPRPVATAIKNLFALLGDSSSNANSFSPGLLNYTLSNMPAVSNNLGGGHTLLQKSSDGSFWLCIWNEQQLNNTSTGADITVAPVTVGLSFPVAPTSITVYDPLVGQSAVQSASGTTSVNISLPAHPILVKIVK
jgi:hypothetical protein